MAKSSPNKAHLVACVKQAKAERYTDLIVLRSGRRVILSGMLNGVLSHAATVSQHRTNEKAEEHLLMCKRWLRDAHPGERAPQLAGQVILSIDTGLATSRMIIPRINRSGDNNADVFLKEALHFGIMRHGVAGLVAMLMQQAADAKYEKYQESGLRQ